MKLNNLQILRGISALLVCCFHFREDLNFTDYKAGDILFKNGSIGVPIFFVISGFIMNFTTQRLNFQKRNILSEMLLFFKKRIIRILPLYYLLTFFWIALGGGFLYIQNQELFSRLIHSLFFIPQKDVPPVLFLGWSLNFEMFFYLIFGLSLFFKEQRSAFIIGFFVFFYILGKFLKIDNAIWEMITSSLNLYFIMGILISKLLSKIAIPRKKAVLISSFGITLFSLCFFDIIHLQNELLKTLTVSALVLSFLLFDFSLQIKGNKFLIFLGDISYSLYLVHPFVEIILRKFEPTDFYSIPYFMLKVSASIAIAAIFYQFIEKKATNYLKTQIKA